MKQRCFSWIKRTLAVAVIAPLAMTAVPAAVQADDELPAVNQGRVSFELTTEVVTQYIFRGYELEDSGLILQPGLEIGVNLYEGDGPISSFDVYVGTWNSFHSEKTDSMPGTSGPRAWFESDIYAGFTLGLFEDFYFDFQYILYTSPSSAFDEIHELIFEIGYDDSDLWGGDFALNPYVLFAVEVNNTGGDQAAYFEFGVEPGFTLIDSMDYPVDISFPVAVGLSLDDYYTNISTGKEEVFGYVSVGAVASMPVSFIPRDFGSWTLSAGVKTYFLNDRVMMTDNRSGSSKNVQVVGMLGLTMEY